MMAEVSLADQVVYNPVDSAGVRVKTEPLDSDDFIDQSVSHQEFPTTIPVNAEVKSEPGDIRVTLVDLPICQQQCQDPLALDEERAGNIFKSEAYLIKPCFVLLDRSEVTRYLEAQNEGLNFPIQKKIKIWCLPIKSEISPQSDDGPLDYCVVRDFSQIKDDHETDLYQSSDSEKNNKTQSTKSHHSKDISDSFKCRLCSKILKNKSHVQRHILSVHKKIKNYKCSFCNKQFFAAYDLNLHVIMIHDQIKKKRRDEIFYTKCKLCNKTFRNKYINVHIRDVHNVSNLYYCDMCNGKKFKSKALLRRHTLQVHLKVKNHKCQICKRKFFALSKMKRHVATVHKKLKPFSCVHCKKTFGRKFCLKVHKEKKHHEIKELKKIID